MRNVILKGNFANLDNCKGYTLLELKEVDGIIIRNWLNEDMSIDVNDTNTSTETFEKWYSMKVTTVCDDIEVIMKDTITYFDDNRFKYDGRLIDKDLLYYTLVYDVMARTDVYLYDDKSFEKIKDDYFKTVCNFVCDEINDNGYYNFDAIMEEINEFSIRVYEEIRDKYGLVEREL